MSPTVRINYYSIDHRRFARAHSSVRSDESSEKFCVICLKSFELYVLQRYVASNIKVWQAKASLITQRLSHVERKSRKKLSNNRGTIQFFSDRISCMFETIKLQIVHGKLRRIFNSISNCIEFMSTDWRPINPKLYRMENSSTQLHCLTPIVNLFHLYSHHRSQQDIPLLSNKICCFVSPAPCRRNLTLIRFSHNTTHPHNGLVAVIHTQRPHNECCSHHFIKLNTSAPFFWLTSQQIGRQARKKWLPRVSQILRRNLIAHHSPSIVSREQAVERCEISSRVALL